MAVSGSLLVLGTAPRSLGWYSLCGAQLSGLWHSLLQSCILRRSLVTTALQPRTRVRARPDYSSAAMGKVPVRLKEVVYTLSPYHQNVMASLWKDIPYKLSKKFHENWVSAFTLVIPVVGTYMYAENFREKDKLHHRF